MNKAKNKEIMVTVPARVLLTLVAERLKDRELFPEKLERAKEFLRKVNMKTI